MDFSQLKDQSGQTLLIVVLVMVVSLTVGLSVVLRSITNVRIAAEEENSQRAFSAAEAGIEQALKTGANISNQTLDNNAVIKEVTIQQLSGDQFLVNSGNSIEKNDGVDIWLVEHNEDGTLDYSSGWQELSANSNLTLYWGNSNDGCVNAALEVVVISGTQASPVSTRYAWDACAARRGQNSFDAPDTGFYSLGGKNFYYREEITISSASKGILVRINPLYAKTILAVKGCNENSTPPHASCNTLPTQGKIVESVGSVNETVRKVNFFQGYPKVPAEFFPHTLFSTD